jgi:ABC-type nitrate/sulfonate/bicarbonate transport system substrate-binding protein
MRKIRIIGVPEHFNFPWLKVVEEQPFQAEGLLLEWTDEPKGSGAMNKALREGRADVAVVLTESFIKDRIEGNPGKIIGYHVQSPLIWGIHLSSRHSDKALADLSDVPFAISRYGSGSHLMAFLLARKMGWDTNRLQFELIGDLEGAKVALEAPEPKVFLWEKYMTKPLVDKGLFYRVGEIPTPWPCFVVVASPDVLQNHPDFLKRLRDLVYKKSSSLLEDGQLPSLLSQKYGILEEDIEAWLSQTEWARQAVISKETLTATMETLQTLELIREMVPAEELLVTDLVKLV